MLNSPEFQRRLVESYVADTDTEPSVDRAERDIMVKVMERIAADDLDAAQQQLQSHLGPAVSAVFDFTLGNIHYQRDQFADAARCYDLAVQKHPKFRRAWGNLGEIRFREGEFGGAIEAFTKVIELGGGSAVTYGMLGIAHTRRGADVAAESAFRMASMLAPGTIDWQLGLAESLFRQRRFADAASLFGGMIKDHPERADLWRFQGEAMAMLERPLEAIQDFEMVDRLGGSNHASLNNLGDLYASQQLPDMAVDAYLRAIDSKPDGSLARPIRAAKYLAVSSSLQDARTLVDGIESRCSGRLLPDEQRQLLNVRVRLAIAQGGSEEEAQALERLVALDPLDGDALISLGQYFERNARTDEALLKYEQAGSLDGFEGKSKQARGQLLVRQGKYAEALPLLRRALELDPRESLQRYVEQVERAGQTR